MREKQLWLTSEKKFMNDVKKDKPYANRSAQSFSLCLAQVMLLLMLNADAKNF